MRLIQQLTKVSETEEFKTGILNLAGFKFEEIDELEDLSCRLEKQKLHSLILANCNICETPPFHRLYTAETINATYITAHKRKSKIQIKNKAEAAAIVINKQSWQVLNFSSNNLSLSESETIIKAIVCQKMLRNLSFNYNALGEKGLKILSDYLQDTQSSSLKYLSLEGTLISVKKILPYFIDALKNNSSLRELDLTNNNLNDNDLELLISLLQKNHTLTKINITTNNLSHQLLQKFYSLLENNQKERNSFHSQLLENYKLPKAKMAIMGDDDTMLKVMLGMKSKRTEEAHYLSQEYEGFFPIRNLIFSSNLLLAQSSFLKTLIPQKLNDSTLAAAQQKLNELATTCKQTELSVCIERLARTEFIGGNDHLLDTKIIENRKKEIARIANKMEDGSASIDDIITQLSSIDPATNNLVKNIQEKIILPALRAYSIALNSDCNLQKVIADIDHEINKLEKKREHMQKSYDQIRFAHCDYLDNYDQEHQRLLSLLKTLSLERVIAHELEEIANNLIDIEINPNSLTQENNGNPLILECYLQKKPNCLKLLLSKGGDILLKNHANENVLNQLLNYPDGGPCDEIVIQHIESILNKLWFKIKSHPKFETMKGIKAVLDNYLKIIIKNCQLSKFKQVMTGISSCLEERRQELEIYYSYLAKASQTADEDELNEIFNEMIAIACNAKRGLSRKSQLHDSMIHKLESVISELEIKATALQMDNTLKEFEQLENELNLINSDQKYLQVTVELETSPRTIQRTTAGFFKSPKNIFNWSRLSFTEIPKELKMISAKSFGKW